MCLRKPWLVLFSVTFAIRMLSAQSYEVMALRDLMVPARDGIKLGTNVFLPARGGSVAGSRFPTIVERTPYNKDSAPGSLVVYYGQSWLRSGDTGRSSPLPFRRALVG
jgi:predicted acyl esterase